MNTQKNGHFVMCIRLLSQQKQFSLTRIRKRTLMNKKNICTRLLRVCVSICELKKSQPYLQADRGFPAEAVFWGGGKGAGRFGPKKDNALRATDF
jgi:hypothetical protein